MFEWKIREAKWNLHSNRGTALSIDIEPSATVKQVLQEIRAEEAFKDQEIDTAKLLFKEKELDPDRTLEYYAIEDCSVIKIAQS
uniref:Ubiquitin-like domain-containing protein n=1 Tax=Ascaris lumbricoides TaxID=6252 RepID=A0A0M3HPV6_ASCLU